MPNRTNDKTIALAAQILGGVGSIASITALFGNPIEFLNTQYVFGFAASALLFSAVLLGFNNHSLNTQIRKIDAALSKKQYELDNISSAHNEVLATQHADINSLHNSKLKEVILNSEQSNERAHLLYKSILSCIQNATAKFKDSKREYSEKLNNSRCEEELTIHRESYKESYQQLFCTPAMIIVNEVRNSMKEYAAHKFNIDEDFRVVIKIIHENKNTDDRREWEFSNAIWDQDTWNNKIKYYQKDQLVRYKISNNSAIATLATNKSHVFAKNNLLDNDDNDFIYQNHNEGWQKFYRAKILTSIENRRSNTLYGFFSIDSLNRNDAWLFGEHGNSIPLNIAICASEALSLLFMEAEYYYNNLNELMAERTGSIVDKNRRASDNRV